jgi:hypothetical protein
MDSKKIVLSLIEGRIETIQQLTVECIEMIYNAAFNEAIEKAADTLKNMGEEERIEIYIRELKII